MNQKEKLSLLEHNQKTEKTGILLTSFAIINSVIGGGILSVPFLFSSNGMI